MAYYCFSLTLFMPVYIRICIQKRIFTIIVVIIMTNNCNENVKNESSKFARMEEK